MINVRKNNRLLVKLFLLLGLLVILIVIFPHSYSRYESETEVEVITKIAYYILDASYQRQTIKISDMEPRDEPYVYEFSIANNKDSKRAEMNLEYDLTVNATTNIPLQYELYMNEDYTSPSASNIIVTENIDPDDDGMFLKKIIAPSEYFTYQYDEVNNYTLLIYFPKTYNTYIYHNLIDSVEVVIESRQIVN